MNPPRRNIHNISYRVNTTTVIKHNIIIPMTTTLHCRVTTPDKCNSHCFIGVFRVRLAAVSTSACRSQKLQRPRKRFTHSTSNAFTRRRQRRRLRYINIRRTCSYTLPVRLWPPRLLFSYILWLYVLFRGGLRYTPHYY